MQWPIGITGSRLSFFRQFPRKMEIVSPGSFPLDYAKTFYSNRCPHRRIAEVLAKCGLVKHSGQGVNQMF